MKLIGFFTDINGSLSSKRAILLGFFMLFAITVISNLFWGKSLDPTLKSQVFEGLIIALSLVFGEQAKKIVEVLKGKTPEQQADEITK